MFSGSSIWPLAGHARLLAVFAWTVLMTAGACALEEQLDPHASSNGLHALLAADYVGAVPAIDSGTKAPGRPSAGNGEPEVLPFGSNTEPVVSGQLPDKWHRVKADIARELEIIARCRTGGACPAPAQRLIELSAEGAGQTGRARVGLINRAVDLAIRPVSDESQWGVPDHWSSPFETLQLSRGDCEDYAIVKYMALLAAGVPAGDLKIVILKNAWPDEDHAALAVRADSQWLILDNRTLTMVRDTDVTRATPEYVLDEQGVRRFVGANYPAELPTLTATSSLQRAAPRR